MAKSTIELRQERANLIKNARELVDRVGEEKREMAADERTQYDKIMSDVDKLKINIEDNERSERLEAEERELQDRQQQHQERQDPEKRNNEKENPRATDEYRSAFERYVVSGAARMTQDEVRALSSTKDDEGGYMTASEQFVNRMIKFIDNMVFVRQFATVLPLTTGKSLGVPSLDNDPSDADWTSEVGNVSEDSSMDFGKRSLTPHMLTKLIKVSLILLRSGAMNPEQLVADRLGYKFGITQEKAFLTGNGASQPLGLFTASSKGISTARDVANENTTTAITFNGLKNAKYSLKGGYHSRARWMFHRDAIKDIAKIKDADGRYLWQDSVVANEPDRLLGSPVGMSEYVPNTFTTGQYVGIYGDMSYYWIADAMDFAIQRLVELYAGNNQVGFIGRLETDGMPVLEEAFARVKLA